MSDDSIRTDILDEPEVIEISDDDNRADDGNKFIANSNRIVELSSDEE